jgi:hypothetical protein
MLNVNVRASQEEERRRAGVNACTASPHVIATAVQNKVQTTRAKPRI